MSRRTVVLVVAALAVVVVFGVVRGQTYALDRPSLTATEVDGSVLLEWSAVEGATRYGLWQWDCEDGWQMVGGREWETTQATHVDPVDGRTYKYTVQALNDRGEESDWASRREDRYVWVRETVNPIPSPEFEIAQHSDRIELAFSAVEQAAGYRALVWYEGAGDRWLRMPDVDLETLTVSYYEVEPGVEYYFTMYAYSENKCGYSDVAAYQSVIYDPEPALPFTPTPPAAGGTGGEGTGAVNTPTPTATATPTPESQPRPGEVSFFGASSTQNSITVNWGVPDPPASEYVLRAGRDSNVEQTIYSGSATSFTWTGLDANTRYYLSVFGKNARGESGPFGSVLSGWTKVDPDDLADYVPGAPSGLSAANDPAGGVRLTWSASTRSQPSDCECPFIEFQIFRRQHIPSPPTIRDHHIGTTLGTSYFDSSTQDGVTYVYHVKAFNRHGLSAPSNSVTYHQGPTPAKPAKPGAPTVVTVLTSKEYQVSWSNPNDPGITSFIVLRRSRDEPPGVPFSTIAEGAPSTFGPNALGNYIYTDSGVSCGVEYEYRIQARSAGGLSRHSSSTRVSSVIPCPTPKP